MTEADVSPEKESVQQEALLIVAYENGGLAANAHYSPGPDGLAHLTAAAKCFDALGDQWHQDVMPDNQVQDGPGGSVALPGGTVVSFGSEDIVLLYSLDEMARPVYDVLVGKAPHPIHLWAAASLLRGISQFMISKSMAVQDMKEAAENAARAQLAGQLPQSVRDRIVH